MKILVYPIGVNPYQKLLYDEIKKYSDVQIKFVRSEIIDSQHAFTLGCPIFPIRFLYYRLIGWKILHLHWLSPFVFPTNFRLLRVLSSIYVLTFMFYLKLIGIKIVWTVHEVIPHEQEFHNDILIRKIISRLCNGLIFHSRNSLDEASKFKFDTKRSVVISHGNYLDIYPNTISKSAARKKLGLNIHDFVYLFFGMIKSYKGIDDLLMSFELIISKYKSKNIKLVISGICLDEKLNKLINEFKIKYPKQIVTALHHILDGDVQVYLNTSDVVVLPFKKSTTSGSVFLALSFSRPIIAPLLGVIKDLPMDVGFIYTDQTDGLYFSLEQALKRRKELFSLGLNGYNYISQFSWNIIAKETVFVFNNLDKKV